MTEFVILYDLQFLYRLDEKFIDATAKFKTFFALRQADGFVFNGVNSESLSILAQFFLGVSNERIHFLSFIFF